MRYAIYFVPGPETPLARVGRRLLGYDVESGCRVARPDVLLYRDEVFLAALDEPRRYGFHATLKAPFELRAGVTEAELIVRVEALASAHRPVVLAGLAVVTMGSFIALVPPEQTVDLRNLASACVIELDALRAPMSPADRARRLAKPLSERQIENLDRYGYPHVLDDFRFHMTLTGSLPSEQKPSVVEALRALTTDVDGPVTIDAVTIVAQPSRDASFRVLMRLPLSA